MHVTDYQHCQALADTARAARIEGYEDKIAAEAQLRQIVGISGVHRDTHSTR
jgi:hypothetical protein